MGQFTFKILPIPNNQCPIPKTQYPIPNTQTQNPTNTQYPIPNTQYQIQNPTNICKKSFTNLVNSNQCNGNSNPGT